MTTVEKIHKRCLECMAGNGKEVMKCTSETCELFPYRLQEKTKGAENAVKKYCKLCNPDRVSCPSKCPFATR